MNALAQKWPEWQLGADRRAAAALRLELYRGTYAERIRAVVRDRVRDPESAFEIAKCVHTAHGLAGAVTDAVAVTYQRGCHRELDDAGETAARAFSDLVEESGVSLRAIALNALSWMLGPVILAPYVATVRGVPTLCIAEFTADRTEVRRSPDKPDLIDAVLWQRDDGSFLELDAEGWRYYAENGTDLNGGTVTPHGLTYCPAIPFRSRPWMPADNGEQPGLISNDGRYATRHNGWWGARDHEGLVAATIEVAFRHALGLWARQNNSVDLTVVTGPIENIPEMQAIGHPSRPLYFNARPEEVDVKVLARRIPASDYLVEIAAIVNAAVSRYGIPPSEVTYDNSNSNWGALSIAVRGERLLAQRSAQILWLRTSERTLWLTSCDIVKASTHPLAAALPEREVLRRNLRTSFPDLAEPKEQLERIAAFEAGQKHGLTNAVDLMLAMRPEMTRSEADEFVRENLDAYAQRLEDLVRRNVSLDPEQGVRPIAAAQGQIGGEKSGQVREEKAA